MKRFFRGALLIALTIVTLTFSKNVVLSQAATPTVPLGCGLEGIADWSRSNAFVDLMKQARAFGTADQPWNPPVPLDAKGWPADDFGVVLASWGDMKATGGVYKISFVCATTPQIQLTASPGTISNIKRNATSGVVTADLTYPEGGTQLMLSFRQTKGGVRNLRVLRPGYTSADVFTKPFLEHLKRFQTLRFMDWASTNGSVITSWSQRAIPASPSYAATSTPGSVPWEVCIDLCNLLQKDAWINVPHMADDAYVKQLALLFKKRLSPSLHLYVEYSNEVWNWGFAQANWNLATAKAEVAAGNSILNFDNVNNDGVWAARRIAKRIKEISDTFRKTYVNLDTVRPVLATQIAWPGLWLVEGLNFINNVYGSPNKFLYAAAGAPYFNLGDANTNNALSVDDVLKALTASVNAMKTDQSMEDCATLSRYFNVKFVAYEGGPDTFGDKSIAVKRLASLDPRIRPLCAKYLQIWYGYGFDLFNWFVAGATDYNTPYGTWGLTNDMTNQTAPKILAIDDALAGATPALNQGRPIPGNVDARESAFRSADWKTQPPLSLQANDWRGPFRDFLIRSNADGTFNLDLLTACNTSGAKVRILLNNASVGVLDVPNTGDGAKFAFTKKMALPLSAGMNVVRVRLEGTTSCNVKTLRFAQ